MELDRRQRIILGVAVVFVFLAVIFLVLGRVRRGGDSARVLPAAPVATTTSEVPRAVGDTRGGGAAIVLPPIPPAELAVRQLSATFAERYGSYSTEGNFVNLEDVLPLVTERFAREIEARIARERAKPASGGAVSTTSFAIGVQPTLVEGATRGAATVALRRTEIAAGGTTRSYGQPIVLEVQKVGSGWRVDRATWGAVSG